MVCRRHDVDRIGDQQISPTWCQSVRRSTQCWCPVMAIAFVARYSASKECDWRVVVVRHWLAMPDERRLACGLAGGDKKDVPVVQDTRDVHQVPGNS